MSRAMSMGPFYLPDALYFRFGNAHSGRAGDFAYDLTSDKKNVTINVWYGQSCKEKSEIADNCQLPLEGDPMPQAREYIEQQYEIFLSAGKDGR